MGAFNNTHPDVVTRFMTLQRMPEYLIGWVKAFTTERSLAFSLNGKMEKGEKFEGAIPQGLPASPVLFSIIISINIDLFLNPLDDHTTEYVDGLNDIAISRDITKTTTILEWTFQRKMQAAARMGLRFDLDY
jgi:hypothetical protein